jgi:hypothetical protein
MRIPANDLVSLFHTLYFTYGMPWKSLPAIRVQIDRQSWSIIINMCSKQKQSRNPVAVHDRRP